MPLLADYAITPDVFDMASYSTSGECEAWLQTIRETMLTEGLVRDLRAGEHRFGRLAAPLRRNGLSAEVFIWDDFHDRYLISNLIGISLSNSFDTNTSQSTTWHRLGRVDRDNVRRQFHPRTGPHKLQAPSFKIP